ncbi:hypothetical protein DIPPA_27084 [Diplonema papillatum]|nr:hypothetical protein DIPPA_27084 [Diplonema papillatum]
MQRGIMCEGCRQRFTIPQLKEHLDAPVLNVHDVNFYLRCPDRRTGSRPPTPANLDEYLAQQQQQQQQQQRSTPAAAAGGGSRSLQRELRNRSYESSSVKAGMTLEVPPPRTTLVDRSLLRKTPFMQSMSSEPVADTLKWDARPNPANHQQQQQQQQQQPPPPPLKKTPFQQCVTEGDLADGLKWQEHKARRKKTAWEQSVDPDAPAVDTLRWDPSDVGRARVTPRQLRKWKEEDMLSDAESERYHRVIPRKSYKRKKGVPRNVWEKMQNRENAETRQKAAEGVEKERAVRNRKAAQLASDVKRAASMLRDEQRGKAKLGPNRAFREGDAGYYTEMHSTGSEGGEPTGGGFRRGGGAGWSQGVPPGGRASSGLGAPRRAGMVGVKKRAFGGGGPRQFAAARAEQAARRRQQAGAAAPRRQGAEGNPHGAANAAREFPRDGLRDNSRDFPRGGVSEAPRGFPRDDVRASRDSNRENSRDFQRDGASAAPREFPRNTPQPAAGIGPPKNGPRAQQQQQQVFNGGAQNPAAAAGPAAAAAAGYAAGAAGERGSGISPFGGARSGEQAGGAFSLGGGGTRALHGQRGDTMVGSSPPSFRTQTEPQARGAFGFGGEDAHTPSGTRMMMGSSPPSFRQPEPQARGAFGLGGGGGDTQASHGQRGNTPRMTTGTSPPSFRTQTEPHTRNAFGFGGEGAQTLGNPRGPPSVRQTESQGKGEYAEGEDVRQQQSGAWQQHGAQTLSANPRMVMGSSPPSFRQAEPQGKGHAEGEDVRRQQSGARQRRGEGRNTGVSLRGFESSGADASAGRKKRVDPRHSTHASDGVRGAFGGGGAAGEHGSRPPGANASGGQREYPRGEDAGGRPGQSAWGAGQQPNSHGDAAHASGGQREHPHREDAGQSAWGAGQRDPAGRQPDAWGTANGRQPAAAAWGRPEPAQQQQQQQQQQQSAWGAGQRDPAGQQPHGNDAWGTASGRQQQQQQQQQQQSAWGAGQRDPAGQQPHGNDAWGTASGRQQQQQQQQQQQSAWGAGQRDPAGQQPHGNDAWGTASGRRQQQQQQQQPAGRRASLLREYVRDSNPAPAPNGGHPASWRAPAADRPWSTPAGPASHAADDSGFTFVSRGNLRGGGGSRARSPPPGLVPPAAGFGQSAATDAWAEASAQSPGAVGGGDPLGSTVRLPRKRVSPLVPNAEAWTDDAQPLRVSSPRKVRFVGE